MADDDAFVALTEFLGEWEVPILTEMGSVSDGQTVQEDASNPRSLTDKQRRKRNAQSAKRRVKYLQRLKDERKTLQQQETKLSSELTKLQAARAERLAQPPDKMGLSAWRAIAKRQREKRRQAEERQRKLRAAVVNRGRLIHQLNALLQERQENYQKERLIVHHEADETNGAAVFQTFLAELDALYAQTNEMYRDLEFTVSYSMGYLTRKWDNGVMFFDGTDSTVIPFSYEETSDAISLFMMSDSDGVRYNEGVKDPENTAAVRNNLNYRLESGEKAALVNYTVTRRYEEANRLVFIWRALTEGKGQFSGLHADETGWLVVRPSTAEDDPEAADLPECSMTIMERYVRLVPVCLGGRPSNQVSADRFAKIVIKSDEEEVKEMTEMLDDLLLDSP